MNLFFVGTGSRSLNSNDQRLPRVHIIDANLVVNLSSDLLCYDLLMTGGEFNLSGYHLTAENHIEFLGPDPVLFNATNTMIQCRTWDAKFVDAATLLTLQLTNTEITSSEFYPGADFEYPAVILDGDLGNVSIKTGGANDDNFDSDIANLSLINATEFNLFRNLKVSNQLNIDAGSTFILGTNDHLLLENDLTIINGCTAVTTESYFSTSTATIETNHALTVDRINFRRTTHTGSGSLTTVNGIDFGGNTGIIFDNLAISDLYWIGGSGDFNDINHFSTSSGGPANISCLPDAFTNVIFDNQSGLSNTSVIEFPGGVYYIHDFHIDPSVNETVQFNLLGATSIDAVDIFVNGNISLTSSVTMTYDNSPTNTWHLISNEPHVLDTKGVDMNQIRNEEFETFIELASDLLVSYRIEFEIGDLTTNGYNLTTDVFDIGGNCSGSNCPTKNYDFDGSLILCNLFEASFNYGSLLISGDYKIKCA